jgi:hypothetical protein
MFLREEVDWIHLRRLRRRLLPCSIRRFHRLRRRSNHRHHRHLRQFAKDQLDRLDPENRVNHLEGFLPKAYRQLLL